MAVDKSESSFIKKLIRWIWILFVVGVIGLILLFFAVSKSNLPDLTELENPKYELATMIYTDDNRELGRIYRFNRVPLLYEQISTTVVDALLATEDIRFHNHCGIDARSFARALAYLGTKGGASTITQQLAKQMFTGLKARSFPQRVWQKLKEWYISVQMEKRYTKEEIMAMYLNKFDYLHGAVGLQAASETYFGKTQDQLRVEEAAVLVGMFKNPNQLNPKSHPNNSLKRRSVVLGQMAKYEFIDGNVLDSLKAIPIDLSGFKKSHHSEGPAPYFRQELKKWIKNLLRDKQYFKPDGTAYDIYTDGLKIYTTINYDMQVAAEEEMVEHMREVQKNYFKTWKKRDPWTYDADSDQKKIRKAGLDRIIYQCDRYKSMKESQLGELITEMSSRHPGVKFRDVDIGRMLAEEKKKGYLRKLIARDQISKKMAADYDKLIKSDDWSSLKSYWSEFQDKVDDVFNKPVKMKVFDYVEGGEKEVTMTPLDSLKYHRQHLQFGSVSVEPTTGHMKTWIGGINHKYFKYDHIKSNRQVGSTFKPFIYSAAITMKGMSPCFQIQDIPYTIAPGDGNFYVAEPWTPSNSDGEYSREYYDMYRGLKESKNTVSVYLMKEMGNTELVRNLTNSMGIDAYAKRSDGNFRVPDAPSICLGSADLSVIEMAGAYTTFANNGVYSEPIFVTRITDKNDRVIYNAVEKENTVFSPENNYVMVDLLTKAVQGSYGFADIKSPVGGKTGTTNDYVDGWFVGFTPELVVATWVGGEDPWIRFLSLANGQGARMAKPFFTKFMKRLESDPRFGLDTDKRFYKPSGDLGIELDCEKYKKFIQQVDEDEIEGALNNDEKDLLDELDFEEQ